MNRKHRETSAGEITVEELMKFFAEPNPLGEVRMLSVHPQTGVKMVYGFEEEAEEIFGDDAEVIFELEGKNIFLSCAASDLVRVSSRKYLMGSGIVYKLNRDDDYADMNTDEMAEACLELFGRMQRVRLGQFCFPVIDLNDEAEDDDEKK